MYSARFVCMDCVSVSVPHADPQILTMKWKRRKSRSARPAIWKHLSEITRRKSNHRRLNRTEHKRRAWDIFFSFLFFFFYLFLSLLPSFWLYYAGWNWLVSIMIVCYHPAVLRAVNKNSSIFVLFHNNISNRMKSIFDRSTEREKNDSFSIFFPRECDSPKRQQNGWRHSKNKYLCTQIDKSGTQNRV